MDVAELRALARQTYNYVEPAGPDVAKGWAEELVKKGIAPRGAGEQPDSFDEASTIEFALGEFIGLVQKHSWFAMNAHLNKLHELAGPVPLEPEVADVD